MYSRCNVIIMVFGSLLIVAYVTYIIHQRRKPMTEESQQGKDPSPVYKGDAVHLARIAAAINTLKDESLVLSMERLADKELYMYPDFHPIAIDPQVNLYKILANRRVVKILQQSRSLEQKNRANVCRKLFDDTVQLHKRSIEAVISFYAKPGSPENKNSIYHSRLALGAALLIEADASYLPQVIESITKIEKVGQSVRQRLSQTPVVPSSVNNFLIASAQPDDTLIVSAIGHCITKHYAAKNPLALVFSQSVIGATTASIPVVGWDASLTGFDFPHLNESVPMDESKGVEQITVYSVEDANPPISVSTVVSKLTEALSKME